MSFWNEDTIETAIQNDDRDTLGKAFLALSRWVIAKDVRSPAWMDRADLVQSGALQCFKALSTNCPDRPRMPYFAQVIKFECRRMVIRACRQSAGQLERDDHMVESKSLPDDMAAAILRTEASRVHEEIAFEMVAQFRDGRAHTVAEFLGSGFGQVYRAECRMFCKRLKEELQR